MGKRIVALYKAFRGGEWFRASLDSVSPFVDGIVVVFSEAPWLHGLSLSENCREPLEAFCKDHPDLPVVIRSGAYRYQEDQWTDGIKAIREVFGEDTGVLVVDTDEVWPAEQLARLKRFIITQSATAAFTSGIRTYLRSPLYCIWPPENGPCLVALQNARQDCKQGRFNNVRGGRQHDPSIYFDHFCYVRSDPAEILEKFLNTSSQESTSSDRNWLDTVWPNLPLGKNLHMTPGCEHVWPGIKILPPQALPATTWDLDVTQEEAGKEDRRWRDRLRTIAPRDQLLPEPTWDLSLYRADIEQHVANPDLLLKRMQTSLLENLWLACFASVVPDYGRILEIGCGHGATTTTMALAAPVSAVVDAVDPFEPYSETAAGGTVHGVMEGDEAEFWDTLQHYGCKDRVCHIRAASNKARSRLCLDGYDLVLVDGNHSYEWAQHDIALSMSCLRPGGWLAVHDYTTRFPGVIQAIDECFGDEGAVLAGTSLFYWRVP